MMNENVFVCVHILKHEQQQLKRQRHRQQQRQRQQRPGRYIKTGT